ncbi:hypothetical protein C8R42DRAFT_381826 [Lentinula raphanica]|nr:hypothetical protein C8R42DRAFT_381826 [Lentinula raphanica]
MDTFRSLVQPLVGPSASSAGMIDGMKLVVLGGTVETARRMGSRAWNHFVNSFFLTAHFSEDDYPYDWLMLWLSRRPEWQRSREFETTTRLSTPLSGGSNSSSSRTADNSFGDEDYREWWNETAGPADDHPEIYSYNEDDIPGKVKTRVVFQPTFDTTHTIYYRGHWLRVRRWRKGDNMNNGSWGGSYGYSSGGGGEMLSVSVVARSNTILKQLVLQAKREYEAEAIHRIQIYFADSHGGWRWTDSRHKRPMSSIVLNPGVKEMLLNDTKDFLNSEKWYADRGIPFRRGYLLHGVPGSGKSSLIHAIAGELMLDIYALSLSAAWINDATLTTLMGRVPARCIVLLEDLDAAFTRSTGRRSKKDKKDKKKKDKKDKKKSKDKSDSAANGLGNTSGVVGSGSSSRRRRTGASGINGGANATDAMSDVNTLSLSGLLNALDGVAAAEGRLLFATTNHLDHLDPALSRPGRMDVWIEFKNASQWQAEALFRNFFPSCEEDSTDHHREDVTSRAPTPTPASPSSLSLPSLRSSSSSPLQSHRNSRASSAGPREPNEDGTISLDSGSLPPLVPALTPEEEAEFAAMGLVLPDVPSTASTPGDIENLGAEISGPSSRPSTSSSGRGSWVGLPTVSPSAAPKRPEISTQPTDTSNGTWSPSPSLSSLGSAVWSMPSFVSSTASLVTGAVGAVTGSSPGTRSRTASSPSPPRTSASGSPKSQPRQKTPRTHSSAPLSPSVLSRLAKEFAQKVPDEEFSVASLQGYLLRNKSRPEDAVKGVDVWVEEERRNREKQKGAKKKAKEDEARRKRKERRKEKAKEKEEQKEKEKTQAEPVLTVPSPTAPAAPTDANVVSEPSTTVLPTDSMILMPSSEPEPAAPSVSSPIIVAEPLPAVPVVPLQEVTPPEPEAPVKKSKSKSKSKKSKHTEKSDEDDSDSDSSSSSSDSDDHESSSDSDSDSSSDSSSDDEDENTGPRPRPSTSSTLRTSSFPPSSSFQNSSSSWSVDPSSWEVAVPPNNSWGGW